MEQDGPLVSLSHWRPQNNLYPREPHNITTRVMSTFDLANNHPTAQIDFQPRVRLKSDIPILFRFIISALTIFLNAKAGTAEIVPIFLSLSLARIRSSFRYDFIFFSRILMMMMMLMLLLLIFRLFWSYSMKDYWMKFMFLSITMSKPMQL